MYIFDTLSKLFMWGPPRISPGSWQQFLEIADPARTVKFNTCHNAVGVSRSLSG